jgi:integral membrane protein
VESALKPFRVLAYVVGVMLLVLCVGMVLKYIVGVDWWPSLVIAQIHGFLYMVYLVATMNLGMKARWSWPRILGVMLGGTVPFLRPMPRLRTLLSRSRCDWSSMK